MIPDEGKGSELVTNLWEKKWLSACVVLQTFSSCDSYWYETIELLVSKLH